MSTKWLVPLRDGSQAEIGLHDARKARVLLTGYHVDRASILTASNPSSAKLSNEENSVRNRALRVCLERLRIPSIGCVGVDGSGATSWREESWLALGIQRETALRLGAEFDQNCVLWLDLQVGPALAVTAEGFANRTVGDLIEYG